jgi:ketosteroid isomerase-like protein
MPRILLLLFLLTGSLSSVAKKPPVSPEKQIRAILARQSAAWNRGDIAAYMQAGYWQSDSLLFMGKNGPTRGYDSTLARYQKSYADTAQMGQLTFNIYKVEMLSANSAWVAGGWQLKRTAGNLGGAFLLIWKRFPEGWRIVADHSS